MRKIGFSLVLVLAGSAVVRPAASAPSPTVRWGSQLLRQGNSWYASPEARAAAEAVLGYQSKHGAWPKNTDLLVPATPALLAAVEKEGKADTIDNGATTLPIRFIARLAAETGEAHYRDAALRGLDYVLASQYPNGGFPQFFPLRPGYYSRITYNDGAMILALELLRDVAERRAPFGFVDAARRSRAAAAVTRGIDCILKTQVRQAGGLAVWCAQHDERTLAPAWARKYEPPSLSGSESVGVVRFLMTMARPSPEVVAAVEAAVAWFRAVPIVGQRVESVPVPGGKPDRRLVADPQAPPLWARFYDLETNRPLYMDRDSKPRADFSLVSYERRSGYGYHTDVPAELIERDHPAWRKRLGLSAVAAP